MLLTDIWRSKYLLILKVLFIFQIKTFEAMFATNCFRSLNHLKQIKCLKSIRGINTGNIKKRIVTQELIKDEELDKDFIKISKLFDKVNDVIVGQNCGQNFAVIHLFGKQFLIHSNDIISVRNSMPAKAGEVIKLEKCLLVGNDSFTLIGRPILSRDLVQIEATVLEKTMTETYYNVKAIPRNHVYRRWRFQRFPLTMFRINQINICHPLNQTQDIVN